MVVLRFGVRFKTGQVLHDSFGQTQASTGCQGASQLLIRHAQITPEFLRGGAGSVNHGAPHLTHELFQENGLNLHSGVEAADAVVRGAPLGYALLLQGTQGFGLLVLS
jgi:hypothetical protein